jgi:putative transposase
MNRGNRRAEVFHKPADYDAFVQSIAAARRVLDVDLFAYCLMPNHLHLVWRPHEDGDLGRWMPRLLTTHAKRSHRHYGTTGHVWQGRFKAFPIQDNDHLVTVIRYVERNPSRAELVARAEHWKWSSLPGRLAGDSSLWLAAPAPIDPVWLARVNTPLSVSELAKIQESVTQERPFGSEEWTQSTAKKLGLSFTLRDRGRPKQT